MALAVSGEQVCGTVQLGCQVICRTGTLDKARAICISKSKAPPSGKHLLTDNTSQRMLLAVAGGIGASVGNTGSINFDRAETSAAATDLDKGGTCKD